MRVNVHNYRQPIYHGDNFYGPIHGSIVGGRDNRNIVINGGRYLDYDTGAAPRPSRRRTTRDQLQRRAKNRIDELRAQLAAAEAEYAALVSA